MDIGYLFANDPVVTIANFLDEPLVMVAVNRGNNHLGYRLGDERPSMWGCGRKRTKAEIEADPRHRQDVIETGSQEVEGWEWGA